MGNSYGKGGNRPALCTLSASPFQPVLKINAVIVFAVGPTQVSSTTSSVCLLPTPTRQRKMLQTWLELKWSAPSPLMNPGNPPTITASVRCQAWASCIQPWNFEVASLAPAQPTCIILLWKQWVTFLCTCQLLICVPTFISFTFVTHGCLSFPVFPFTRVSSFNFTQLSHKSTLVYTVQNDTCVKNIN